MTHSRAFVWRDFRIIQAGLFNHACDTKSEQLKSVASSETTLQDFTTRMQWIRRAADQFHRLMQTQKNIWGMS
ncbi:DUF2515 family protein [Duganella sp. Leaf126]|uniref:DUF2515 family protein n=1 Tax=Duganella sp. Leaf126 TaxID=1736266 RepID=UPI0035A65BFA